MAQQDQETDKEYEATPKKLEDARKKGEVARSADLTNAAAYGGFAVVALTGGYFLLTELAGRLSGLLANSPDLADDVFHGGAQARFGGMIYSVTSVIAPWFVLPGIAALIAIIATQTFVVAPSKLQPKLSRVSIVANAKNKFGRGGLFEFAKALTKLMVFSTILGLFLYFKTPRILGTVTLSSTNVSAELFSLSLSFILLILLVATTIGGVDFLWQKAEHLRKNRMSRKEITDEAKQMEGDPHIKQQRRQKGQEIAMNRMLADVPDADVVVVNPTHYAVALKWSRLPGSAPICVAKGVDEISARIREIARENGVSIHRDPPTARALYATVAIGEPIAPEHYGPVAAAIRFAEEMRQRASDMGSRIS